MKIELKSIKMNNFKAQKDLTVNFTARTDIIGANKSGKTSIQDAWLWLLFDRDTRGNKGASACKTTHDGKFVHHLDHEVEAEILVDGNPVKLKKVLSENWVKPRANPEARYDGNTAYYWVDDMSLALNQYTEWLKAIGASSLLQCLTDLAYFSESLTWKERLNYLMDMSGGITNEEVATGDQGLMNLLAEAGTKDLSDFKAITQSQIKKVKEELEKLPVQINEQNKMIVEEDWDALEKEVKTEQELLEQVIASETNAAKAMEPYIALGYQRERLLKEKNTLMQKLADEANEDTVKLKNVVSALNREKAITEQDLADVHNASTDLLNQIVSTEKNTDVLREDVKKLIAELQEARVLEMDLVAEDYFECPTCHQSLPEAMRNKKLGIIKDNFDREKKSLISRLESDIENIKAKGVRNNAKVEELKQKLSGNEMEAEKLEFGKKDIRGKLDSSYETLSLLSNHQPVDFENHLDVLEITAEIMGIDEQIAKFTIPNNTENAQKKAEITARIDALKTRLYARKTNDKALYTISEYEDSMKTHGINQAFLEGLLYQCDRFVVVRTEKMEGKINSMFKDVTFKLFKEQINGGIEETCEAIVNGTTFHDANTAGQINAGLDIISTLMDHYGIQMPVFVDNLNLITDPRQLNTQMIRMVVKKGSPLTIENY